MERIMVRGIRLGLRRALALRKRFGADGLATPFGLGGEGERCGELLVAGKEEFHTGAVAGEGRGAVAFVHRLIERGVRGG